MTDELPSTLRSLAELLGEAGRHPPATPEALAAAEHRLKIHLPGPLRALLEAFDGSAPTDVDHGWITFWSANELEAAVHCTAGRYELPGAIVFADHGLHAWWYAVRASVVRVQVCRLSSV